MNSISAAGIGSGLDIASLVSQLVDAERAPAEQRLSKEESTARAQISAFGSLKSALALLGGALKALIPVTALDARRATSSDSAVVAATATAGAASATYEVEVVSLASAQRLSSAPYASSASIVGTGTLTLDSGDNTFSVVVDGSNNSLAGIRDAINAAPGNSSISASVLNTVEGARLVLSARNSGAAAAITVTRSGGDGGLDALVYEPGVLTNLEQKVPAADSLVRIDGFNFGSASNRLEGAVDGVVFNLLAEAPGSVKTVTVSRDSEAARKALESFVSSYNSALGAFSATTRYDASTRTASALTGDALPRAAAASLRRLIGAANEGTGAIRTLADLGISTSVSGALTLDAGKFQRVLNERPTEVTALLSGSDGLAARLDGIVQGLVGSGGAIEGRTRGLDARLETVSDRRSALATRMEALEARYRAQFTAMDGLVAQLRTTSDFLTQQLR